MDRKKDGEETEIGTDDSYDVSVTIRNTGPREGTEVVQLYLHDPVARVTRPDVRLIGYHRLTLPPARPAASRSPSTRTSRPSQTARANA